MKAHGVQPVAIWDEKGDRPWKAPEARRRLEARTISLARKLHEDRRAVRLDRLRRELVRFACLSDVEQEVVQMWWADYESQGPDSASERQSSENAMSPGPDDSTGSTGSAAALLPRSSSIIPFHPNFILTAYIVARLAGHLKRLSWIVDSYLSDKYPEVRSGPRPMTLFESFEAEEEAVWRIASGQEDGKMNALARSEDAQIWTEESDVIAAALEARLISLEPASVYRETPRQRALTDEEGEVYDLVFGRPEDIGERQEDAELILAAALEQVDRIRDSAPEVRNTYVSNLFTPLESEHADCRELLDRMGVPVLIAPVPYEAEGYASAMALNGAVDFVGTEDSDVIVYGAPLLRNLSTANEPLVLVDSEKLRTMTGLSEPVFRDFCILLGTDASPRIPGVGPFTARTLIDKYASADAANSKGIIEAILHGDPETRRRLKNLAPRAAGEAGIGDDDATQEEVDGFMTMVHNSRRLFGLLPPTPGRAELAAREVAYTDERDDAVRAWLLERHGLRVRRSSESPTSAGWEHESDLTEEPAGIVRLDYTRQADEMYRDEQQRGDAAARTVWDEVWEGDAVA